MKTEKVKQNLKKNKDTLETEFKVEDIGIFGSFSREEQTEGSDVDILVEFSEPVGFFTFLDLKEYLEEQLKREVDLVTKNALKKRIGERILNEVSYL